MKLRWLTQARDVAVYLAVGSELATGELIARLWRAGKRVYVPRVQAEASMDFVLYERTTPLRRNVHGIDEPARGLPRRASRLDLVVMPLVGFDARGNRLGSGAGYYDRALGGLRAAQRPWLVGYAYAVQEVAALPSDPWDVRLDVVVTETGVRRWRTG